MCFILMTGCKKVWLAGAAEDNCALSKLSEIELVKKLTGNNPILLLDDVLSELDSSRQNYLLNSIGDIQTIITCTGLDEFINNRININKVFKVTNGTVSHVQCGDAAAEMR